MLGATQEARGSAHGAMRGSLRAVAGKTGTAQVFSIAQEEEYEEEGLDERLRDHGLFVAYGPAEAPTIALAVVVENGGGGSRAAAPVARQVLDAYFREIG
jgi:penicillin-binding protein 2